MFTRNQTHPARDPSVPPRWTRNRQGPPGQALNQGKRRVSMEGGIGCSSCLSTGWSLPQRRRASAPTCPATPVGSERRAACRPRRDSASPASAASPTAGSVNSGARGPLSRGGDPDAGRRGTRPGRHRSPLAMGFPQTLLWLAIPPSTAQEKLVKEGGRTRMTAYRSRPIRHSGLPEICPNSKQQTTTWNSAAGQRPPRLRWTIWQRIPRLAAG